MYLIRRINVDISMNEKEKKLIVYFLVKKYMQSLKLTQLTVVRNTYAIMDQPNT